MAAIATDGPKDDRMPAPPKCQNLDGHRSRSDLGYCPAHEDDDARDPTLATAFTIGDTYTLIALSKATDSGLTRGAVARNRSAPAEVLVALAGDADPYVRAGVCANPATPFGVARALVSDPVGWVPVAAGQASDADPRLLAHIALGGPAAARRASAMNPATPTAVLQALADDTAVTVRRGLACNPATPAATLLALMQEGDGVIDTEAAAQASLPSDVLAAVIARGGEPAEAVALRLLQNGVSGAVALAQRREASYGVLAGAAANPTLPLPLARALASSPAAVVTSALAANMALPWEGVAPLLTETGDAYALAALASRPDIPGPALRALCEHENGEASRAARRHVRAFVLRQGVDDDNTEAIAVAAEGAWWELERDSAALELLLTLYPNP